MWMNLSWRGEMDPRKLMVDLSCELVEQTISFREFSEKRLGHFLGMEGSRARMLGEGLMS